MTTSKVRKLEPRKEMDRLNTPTDLSDEAIEKVSVALNGLLADTFALYVKTKNFHWHISGPHFRDYHLLLDEQAAQVEASIDILAERVRKSAARRFARSATSPSSSGCRTTTRMSSCPATC